MTSASPRNRPEMRGDWKAQRERIDLAAVAIRLLGEPPGRRGERGRRLWWSCPFHPDHNPSFCVDPDKPWWRCYGCEAKGDAAALVMRVIRCTFPEAVAYLSGGPPPAGRPRLPKPGPRPEPPADPGPTGMIPEAAEALVAESVARLWSPEGSDALAYLTGPERCLTPGTIRGARLGVVFDPLPIAGRPRGIVVPWLRGDRPTLVKIRQPGGRRPKYYEAHRDRARHAGIYPDPAAIRPGLPLVIVEGEFDALCLSHELSDLASVVTLGSASARPDPAILGRMLAAAPWLIATDQDAAGDTSARAWPASARRIRPPGSFKDWTEAKAGGIDLARWWRDRLAGIEQPHLDPWAELKEWRWGQAVGVQTPGIDIVRPNREAMRRAVAALANDPEAAEERRAIQVG